MSKYTRASRTDGFDGAARRAHDRVMQELRRAESVVTTPTQTIQPPRERRTRPKNGLWIVRSTPQESLPKHGTLSTLQTPPFLDILSNEESAHLARLFGAGEITEATLLEHIGKAGLDIALEGVEVERVFTEKASDRYSTVFALPSSDAVGSARQMHADFMSRVDVTYPHGRPPVRINFGTFSNEVAQNLVGVVRQVTNDGISLGGAVISYLR